MSYKRHNQREYQIPIRRQNIKSSLHGRGCQKRYPGINVARQVFEERSARSRGQDLVRVAQIAPSVQVWLKDPSRWDLPNVDTPDARRIFEHRSTREKAQDLARRARKTKNIELWAGNVNRYDFDNIDTPPEGKHIRRFKVMPKEEGKKLELKRTESKKTEEKKHTLPSKEEILQRAQEMHKEELVKGGLPALSAEESELKESGTFEEARTDLMRGEKSKADAQIEGYIHDLNSELEPMGYRVVEID